MRFLEQDKALEELLWKYKSGKNNNEFPADLNQLRTDVLRYNAALGERGHTQNTVTSHVLNAKHRDTNSHEYRVPEERRNSSRPNPPYRNPSYHQNHNTNDNQRREPQKDNKSHPKKYKPKPKAHLTIAAMAKGGRATNSGCLVDTGATHHIVSDKAWLVNIRKLPKPVTIHTANGIIHAHSLGTIPNIGDALILPGLKHHLI